MRLHQQRFGGQPIAVQTLFQALQRSAHDRPQARVQRRRHRTTVFAHARQQVARQRHQRARNLLLDNLADPLLVDIVLERPQQTHGKHFGAAGAQLTHRATHIHLIERRHHPAAIVDTLGDLDDQALRYYQFLLDQRTEVLDGGFVEAERLEATHDRDCVAEASRLDQACDGALTLQHGVGGDRGSVREE